MKKMIVGLAFILSLATTVASAAVIVEYNFDGNSLDTSGNSEDLTLFNGATYGAGYVGQALLLDGVDDYAYVNIGNYGLTNFTVEAWINVPSYDSNVHYVNLYQDNYLVLGDYGGGLTGVISTWADGLNPINAGDSGAVETTPFINEWHHIAFTYDGTSQKIYVDGVLEKTIATTGSLNSSGAYNQGLTIGARHTHSLQFVQGLLDNVRIHDVALTAAQLGYFLDAKNTSTSIPTLSNTGILLLVLLLVTFLYRGQKNRA